MSVISSESSQPQYLFVDHIYICSQCQSHLSAKQYCVSKQFKGKHGKAYLMNKLINIDLTSQQDVILMTGKHTISNVNCKVCQSYVGWKYVDAQDQTNQYKINKFVLQKQVTRTLDYYKED